MTKSEMTARYDAAMKDLSAQKMNQSAQAYAAGAAILLSMRVSCFTNLHLGRNSSCWFWVSLRPFTWHNRYNQDASQSVENSVSKWSRT